MDLIESLLDESTVDETTGLAPRKATPYIQTAGVIDPRIRELSYSSILTLHNCPREFQLYKLRTQNKLAVSEKSNITFAFGHVVGSGIQDVIAGIPWPKVVWNMFLGWHADLFASDDKASKSFWHAVIAVEKFRNMRNAGFLSDYELVIHNDKPAVELSFVINFPDGFRYRGFVDVVLRNRLSGAIVVLELKTTGSSSFSPAQYKNSAQAIGYSIVLDVLFPALSSYEVIYLIYQTAKQEYTPIPFTKSYLQRALWIKELLLDIEMIKLYEEAQVYPMHGESCYRFFRECSYINSCQMSTSLLADGFDPEIHTDETQYQISVSLSDVIAAQLTKHEVYEHGNLNGEFNGPNELGIEDTFL
jgi:hypothetical protein